MAPGDVCHGPRCSLVRLGPVALEYRSCHWPGGSAGSPQCVRPMGCWFFHVPRPPYVCAVSWATWLPFTGAPAGCVVLRVRCPGPLGSCSPVRPLGVLLCVCGVLGLLAPVHRCARSVCCVACAVSWATWLLFTGVHPLCVVLRTSSSCSTCCFGLGFQLQNLQDFIKISRALIKDIFLILQCIGEFYCYTENGMTLRFGTVCCCVR